MSGCSDNPIVNLPFVWKLQHSLKNQEVKGHDSKTISLLNTFEYLINRDLNSLLLGNVCDLCPGTATQDLVDENGCSGPQVDPDDDGICSPGLELT